VKDDILKLEKVQDYRFGSMVKGKHYAFARGLTINPTHLPAALDAMENDGWTLMAVFGETNSENVGFVFRRVSPSISRLELVHGFEQPATFAKVSNPEAERKWEQFNDGVPISEIK
jgi:hypothetical protein